MSRGCDGFVLENDDESDELIASIWPDNFIVKLLYKITVYFLFVLVGMPYLNRILITFKTQITNSMDAHWAVIKSLIEMIEELQKENQRLRSERDAAKRETRTRTANAATTLRRPNTQPPAYTSFAIPVTVSNNFFKFLFDHSFDKKKLITFVLGRYKV